MQSRRARRLGGQAYERAEGRGGKEKAPRAPAREAFFVWTYAPLK